MYLAEVFDFGLQQHKIKMDGKFFENNLFAVAGDTGRRLEVQLLDSNNMIQNTTGISLRLNADVAGKTTYAEATLVDATKGLYELDLPNGMLMAPGNWQFQWQIIGATGEKLHSFAFMGNVGSNLSEGGTKATNFYLNAEDLKDLQEDFINGTIDSALLQTNIESVLTNLEESFLPRLLENESKIGKLGSVATYKGTDTYANIISKTGMAVGDEWYDSTNSQSLRWNGTAWLPVGNALKLGADSVTTDKYAPHSLTPVKTSFLESDLSIESAYDIMPDKLSAIGDFYDITNGNFANNSNTQNFKNTGKIYLTQDGAIESYGNHSLLFFNTSDVFLSSTQHDSDADLAIIRQITPPKGSSYFIANVPKPYWWDKDDAVFKNLTATLRFIPVKNTMSELKILDENYPKVTDSDFEPLNILASMTMSASGKGLEVTTGLEAIQEGRKHSDWIDVTSSTFMSLGVSHILFKMEDGTYIPGYYSYNNDAALSIWQTWSPPKGAKQMAINLVTYYFELAELFQITASEKIPSITSLEKKIDSANLFTGKTILNMGDSIEAGSGYPSDISTLISNELKTNAINMGFGGTRASHHPNTNFNNFSLYKLVDAILSKDFTAQKASALVTGQTIPPYYRTKIVTLENLDLNSVDVLSLAYGTNDWNGVQPLSNTSDPLDTNSYVGALRYSITKLLQAYPHLKIILNTPIYRFKEDLSADSDNWIAGDKKLTDFVDAVPVLAKELKLPYVDCYYSLGINKYNRFTYFTTKDGTHVNFNGRKLIAHKRARAIKNAY